MELVLIRHGETEWSLNGRHTGRTDLDLTDYGRAEAEALKALIARMLPPVGDEVVISSPRARARQTAEIALSDRMVRVDERLAEFDYGDFEGLTKAEILVKKPGWSIWFDGGPNGETPADAARRADDFLHVHAGHDRVIAVSHGHMGRILAARALGLGPDMGRILTVATASLSVITAVGTAPTIVRWNAVA